MPHDHRARRAKVVVGLLTSQPLAATARYSIAKLYASGSLNLQTRPIQIESPTSSPHNIHSSAILNAVRPEARIATTTMAISSTATQIRAAINP